MKHIREGYKETEVGVIPVDWEVKKLGELGDSYNGLSGKTKEDFGEGADYITYMNVFKNRKIDPLVIDKVMVAEDENQTSVQYGDILFTISSETVEEVGMTSVMLDRLEKVYLNSFCFGFRLNNLDIFSPEFASYLFRESGMRKRIALFGQGSTRYNLSKNSLKEKLNIPLPPLPEQEKIASILSSVDEQIEAVEEQIASTKELKKGLMQKLLTKGIGHTKFKQTELGEIPVDWEVKKLGDVLKKIVGGGTPQREKTYYYDGDIPWATVKDMTSEVYKWDTIEHINKEAIENSSANLIKEETFIIATRMGLGRGFVNKVKMAINQDLKALIVNNDIKNKYLMYWYS